ncbi:hypothetical protein [Leptospira sp. 'Mane']|uniref:hypothetical protein n=1 Tax=Leptospira sp. 'Mane' TaxID=3387407 RepID=UPI00398B3BF3
METEDELKLGKVGAFRFTISTFREILAKQDGRCYVTGRKITGTNADAELIKPIPKKGELKKDNVCLIIDSLRDLKRYHTMKEIYEIALDIVKVYEEKAKNQKQPSKNT